MAATLNSGQVFHWVPHTVEDVEGFIGTIHETPTFLADIGNENLLSIQPRLDSEVTVETYLSLSPKEVEIRSTFPSDDPFFQSALNYCPGLRIIRQPTWECLATFITSSMKQVAHIRDISQTLRQRFGIRHDFLNRSIYSYPTPEKLAEAGEAALRDCALGYRAKSLYLTATAIASGDINLADLAHIEDHKEARDFLCQFHGVGEKIANCTLLFGCNRLGAFPIDVWIERVLRKGYRKRIKGAKLQKWAESYFGPYAGYAQQFLFHYARVGRLGE